MRPVLRVGVLLILSFVALAACAASSASAPAPTAWQAVKAAPGDRVELTSDQYQLLMFYAPQ